MHLPPMRPSFGTSLPQIVTHICQKAIFKHALGEEVTMGRYDFRRTLAPFIPSQVSRHSCGQLFQAERLGYVIITASLQAVYFVLFRNPGCQKQNGADDILTDRFT